MKTHPYFLLFLLSLFINKMHAYQPASTFTFVAPCQPFATITQVPNMPGCFSFSASNAGASGPDEYYSWNFGDGSSAIGNPLTHCYTGSPAGSTFTVSVAYNSTLACGSSTLQQEYQVVSGQSAPTGIKERNIKNAQVKLFPNPAADQVTVHYQPDVSTMAVFDQTGKERTRQKANSLGFTVISLTDYAEGLYIVKLISTDGSENNVKFIKK